MGLFDGDSDTGSQPHVGGEGDSQSAGAGALSIESPAADAIISEPGVITIAGRADGLEQVTVNGVAVQVLSDRFEHALQVDADGAVTIRVEGGGEVQERTVRVDLLGPAIQVTHPARGAHLDASAGSTIEVKGQVVDTTQIESLTVGGEAVAVAPDGTFTASIPAVPGTNVITVEATDGAGHTSQDRRAVLHGSYAPWGRPVDDAITARVSAEGLALVADALSGSLGPDLLANLGGGVDVPPSPEFELRGLNLQGIEVELVPQDGYIDTTLRIYGLQIDFAAQFNGSQVVGDIESSPAEMRVNIMLETDGSGGLDVRMAGGEVELHDFDFDVRGLLGLFDWIIKGAVEDGIEEALVEFLADYVVEDLLTADSLTQTAEVLGVQSTFQLLITDTGVDTAGLGVTMDASLDAGQGPGIPNTPGSYVTPSAAPAGPADAAIRLSLADDFINQLLGSLWRTGNLSIDLGEVLAGLSEGGTALPIELNAEFISGLTGSTELLEIVPPEAEVGILLAPQMPPVVKVGGPDGQVMQLEFGEVHFRFTADKAGTPIHWGTITTHIFVDVAMKPGENGEDELDLKITATADLVEEPLFDIDDKKAESSLTSLLGLIPSLLGGAEPEEMADLGEVPDPGLAVDGLKLIADGPQGDFLSILFDLVVDLTPDLPRSWRSSTRRSVRRTVTRITSWPRARGPRPRRPHGRWADIWPPSATTTKTTGSWTSSAGSTARPATCGSDCTTWGTRVSSVGPAANPWNGRTLTARGRTTAVRTRMACGTRTSFTSTATAVLAVTVAGTTSVTPARRPGTRDSTGSSN